MDSNPILVRCPFISDDRGKSDEIRQTGVIHSLMTKSRYEILETPDDRHSSIVSESKGAMEMMLYKGA